MKSTKWTQKPITWGAYCIMAIISFVIGIIGGLVYLVELLSPSWWVDFKEFVKRPFKKLAESRSHEDEA